MDIIGNNAEVRGASGAAYGGGAYDFTDSIASVGEWVSPAEAVGSWTWVPMTNVTCSFSTSDADGRDVLSGYIDAVDGWRTDRVVSALWTRKPDRAMGETEKEVAFDTFEEVLEDAS